MKLKKWLAAQGRGGLSRLANATGVAHQTLRNVRDGKKWPGGTACSLEVARAIERHTDGAVSEAEAQYPWRRTRSGKVAGAS